MKTFVCLALFALIAVALALDPPKDHKKEDKETKGVEATKTGTRDGRYLLVSDRGVYDNLYRSYVVVGTPSYRDYLGYYSASSYYV